MCAGSVETSTHGADAESIVPFDPHRLTPRHGNAAAAAAAAADGSGATRQQGQQGYGSSELLDKKVLFMTAAVSESWIIALIRSQYSLLFISDLSVDLPFSPHPAALSDMEISVACSRAT